LTGGRYLKLLHGNLTTLAALALNWTIENQWPMEQSGQDEYAVMHYEELVSKPSVAWRRLCDWLHLTRVPELADLHRPSQKASTQAEFQVAWEEPRWRARLTKEQLEEIQTILDKTACTVYNIKDAAPAIKSLDPHVATGGGDGGL
jgi:hypothetical protein